MIRNGPPDYSSDPYFRIDYEKLKKADAHTRMLVIQMAKPIADRRRRIEELQAELKGCTDIWQRHCLEGEIAQIRDTIRRDYERVGPYEKKH
jgi:hypothetical protein